MTIHAVLPGVLLLASCAGPERAVVPDRRPEPHVTVAWSTRRESDAYRHEVDVMSRTDGEPVRVRRSGLLYVERSPRGRLRAVPAEGHEELRPLPVGDEDAFDLYFPLPPEGWIGAAPVERRYRVPRIDALGVAGDITVREVLTRTGRQGPRLRLRFERQIVAGPEEEISAEGEGVFDTEARRYVEVTLRLHAHGPGSSVEPPDVEGEVRLVHDELESLARHAFLAGLRAAESEGAVGYDSWMRDHGRDDELAEIAAGLAGAPVEVSRLEWFHARASPIEMWGLLLSQPPGERRDHLVWVLVIGPTLAGEELDEEVIALIEAHLGEQRDLRLLVTRLDDPRFRPHLVRMARSRDDPELARAARLALELMDEEGVVTPERVRASLADEDLLVELLSRYLAGTDDPRPIVPVLIEGLGRDDVTPFIVDSIVEVLESLTFRSYGKDAAAWSRFWETHREVPFEQWIVDGTGHPDARHRLQAFGLLAEVEPFEAGRERLVLALDDRHLLVRLIAAEVLARWHDPRAAGALIELLRDPDPQTRDLAFMALGHLAEATMGYDPDAPAVERARAIGRFRQWARRRSAAAAD
jgi:hypothetical protein